MRRPPRWGPPPAGLRRVDLPIASRAILVGATFAFAISIGDFGAALLLSRPEFSTMNVAIFRYLSLPARNGWARRWR